MPFSNTASHPMSGMSGMTSIAEKIGKAQQEGYTLTKKGSAVGNTPDISATLQEPWSPPASSASRVGVAACEIPAGLSGLWGAGGLLFAPHGAACRPQKGELVASRLRAASQAAPLANWSGGKSL
jgi:hypothetical protein